MVRRDWSLKPNGQVPDLVFRSGGPTPTAGRAKGTFATRGFLGDYEVQVVAGGKTRMVKTSLGKDGRTVECVLQ
jgi:hypothetical protein